MGAVQAYIDLENSSTEVPLQKPVSGGQRAAWKKAVSSYTSYGTTWPWKPLTIFSPKPPMLNVNKMLWR